MLEWFQSNPVSVELAAPSAMIATITRLVRTSSATQVSRTAAAFVEREPTVWHTIFVYKEAVMTSKHVKNFISALHTCHTLPADPTRQAGLPLLS